MTGTGEHGTLRGMDAPGLQNAVRATTEALQHGTLGEILKFCSAHTGLPVTVVASGAIVASARLVRRVSAVLLEIGVVMAALALLTKLDWIRW